MPSIRIGLGIDVQNTPQMVYDPDALAFFTATGITNATIKNAVNFLVRSSKGLDTSFNPTGANIWAKQLCDRPYVGGTATTHKYNLVNPALYIATFNGGFTHDANGVTGSVNGYCDEGFSPSDLGQNTAGVSAYSRTSSVGSNPTWQIVVSGVVFELIIKYTDNNTYTAVNNNSSEDVTPNTDSTGCFILSRQSSTTYNLFIRGAKTIKTVTSFTASVLHFFTWSRNTAGVASFFSSKNLARTTFFNAALTDTEAAAYTAINQQFQTLLSRQV